MTTRKKTVTPKPEPIPVNVVCSLCGELWSLHREDDNGDVTTLECIRLLKARQYAPTIVYRDRWNWPYYQYPITYGGGTYVGNQTTPRPPNYSGGAQVTLCSTQQATNTATPIVVNASAA